MPDKICESCGRENLSSYKRECGTCYQRRIYRERPERRKAVKASNKRWYDKKMKDPEYVEHWRARCRVNQKRYHDRKREEALLTSRRSPVE